VERATLTAGVVAGGQEDATRGLALANDVAGGGRRQNAVLADQELPDAVCRTDLGNQLDDLGVPEPSIAANDEEGTFRRALSAIPHHVTPRQGL
jgi:hypothetical protein